MWPTTLILFGHLILSLLVTASPATQSYRTRNSFPLVPQNETSKRSQIPRAPGFEWGKQPMRGVNIGGWLVLEPWITPSMFENKPSWVVDEWTYGEFMRTQADSLGEIRSHWNSWFQFQELEAIAAAGLNTIRIQIGYWSLIPLDTGEPYLVGAYEYLKLAVTWAQSLNLKVMLDLHGTPGSQNGFDNSGFRNTREWFRNDTNLYRTLNALQILTSEFTQSSYNNTVQTIELINEPFPYNADELNFLKRFYTSAYDTVRGANKQDTIVVAIDEGFQGVDSWNGFMTEPQWHDVALDTHVYAMFNTETLAYGYVANLQWTCSQIDALTQANLYHWTIVGEFTPANTDCAKWLNGRGAGARYDNTLAGVEKLNFSGDCSTRTGPDGSQFGADYVDHLARSFEAQTWVYEQASGWIMWTWKTERAADWSMAMGITYGWILTPITAKPHGTPCNFSSPRSNSAKTNSSCVTTLRPRLLFVWILSFVALSIIVLCALSSS